MRLATEPATENKPRLTAITITHPSLYMMKQLIGRGGLGEIITLTFLYLADVERHRFMMRREDLTKICFKLADFDDHALGT